MPGPAATISLDLDNEWAYLRVHGDAEWSAFRSYFDLVVPRILKVLADRRLTITFFVVGQDAALERNAAALQQIRQAGHEIANHSFHHQPSFVRQPVDEIDREIREAEDAIESATGVKTVGFRGPGFSVTPELLGVLTRRGYVYDASTFPTFVGPVARMVYRSTVREGAAGAEDRQGLYGEWRDVLRPLRPYRWELPEGSLLELPVTTFPVFRTPFHLTYVHFLAERSPALALAYFRAALAACRIRGVSPSVLLHPLDFLGGDEVPSLRFFPGMKRSGDQKTAVVDLVLEMICARFSPTTLGAYAARWTGTLK